MTGRSECFFRNAGATLVVLAGFCVQAQADDIRSFDLRIANGRLSDAPKIIQVSRDDTVKIRWSANRITIVHLHGYDIQIVVEPLRPQTMSFGARATGRFPFEMHDDSKGRHRVLIYLEVLPR